MLLPVDENAEAAENLRAQQVAYARELDRQIELRRARQREEQRQAEELERKFAPSERSPAKWLVEGGHFDLLRATAGSSPAPGATHSPWRFPRATEELGQQEEHPFEEYEQQQQQQQQDRGASTGEAATASASHPRFRVTDGAETSERLRERAQQMQWKRLLDEQVQENARLKEQQEAEQRRSEADAAREEVQYLREQQLRAQRRLGMGRLASPTPTDRTPASSPQYRPIPSPPQPQRVDFQSSSASLGRQFPSMRNIPPMNDEDSKLQYQANRQYGSTTADSMLPPPAPSRLQMQQSIGRMNTMGEATRGTFDRDSMNGVPGRSSSFSEAAERQQQQNSHVLEEYRALLTEIRREREELRRERDEVRHEKEELRVQRALLQLENEKMASLVDAQRALNDQQVELQTQQQELQYQAPSYQPELSPARSVSFRAERRRDEIGMPHQVDTAPATHEYSRLNQVRQSLGNLALGDHQFPSANSPMQQRRRKPPSPMSMADFSNAAAPTTRFTPNVVDSPRFQRLSRYRRNVMQDAGGENPLDQSLTGESVFVPVSPKALRGFEEGEETKEQSRHIPASFSPKAGDRRGEVETGRPNPLRNSRVIKSRGFYDLDSELMEQRTRVPPRGKISSSIEDSERSQLSESYYFDQRRDDRGESESEMDEEDEQSEEEDGSEDRLDGATSGLFQVKVLV